MDADEALGRAGISPLQLMPKEGLGLINGTQAMTALGAIALYDSMAMAITADAARVPVYRGVERDSRRFPRLPSPGHDPIRARCRMCRARSAGCFREVSL
jgi:hypothetical protein